MTDIATLLFVTAVLCVCAGGSFLVHQYGLKRINGFDLIGLGYLSIGAGIATAAIQSGLPRMISVTLPSLAIAAGFIFILQGVVRFRMSNGKSVLLNVALLAVVFLGAIFLSRQGSCLACLKIVSALLCLMISAAMVRKLDPGLRKSHYMPAGVFFLFALYLAAGAAVIIGSDPGRAMGAALAGVSLLVFDTLIVFSCMGFFWMAIAEQERELIRLARIDPLTKLFNRRALDELAMREISRARRHTLPLSIIILDMDRFKEINDNHGRQAGDSILVRAAELLIDNLRHHDLVSRLGGVEYLILLPDTGRALALQVAEKLRALVEHEPFRLSKNRLRLTASLGVASLRRKDDWSSLLTRADKALRQAKDNGRNRVEAEPAE